MLSSGNQCHAILKKIRELFIPEHLKPFEDILFTLKQVHHISNQQTLPHDYPEVLDTFRHSWYKLKLTFQISTTPKMHIILDPLEDYFNDTGLTLIKVTDEMVESCHQYLHKRLLNSYNLTKDVNNPSHHNTSAIVF